MVEQEDPGFKGLFVKTDIIHGPLTIGHQVSLHLSSDFLGYNLIWYKDKNDIKNIALSDVM